MACVAYGAPHCGILPPRQSGNGQKRGSVDRMLSDAECRRHNQLPPPTHAPLLPPSTTSQLDCRHYLRCSGCTLDNSLDSPPIYQEAAAFFQSLDVVLPPLRVGNVHGWRHRARLAVRAHSARDPRPAIGLFAEGTHSVMPISDCRVHHPSINAAVAAVAECAEAAGVSGYNERTGLGQLRYLQATVVGNEPSSSKGSGSGGRARVQLALVWNSSATEEEELAAKASAAAQAAVSRAQRQAWRRPPRQPHATPLRHLASELWLRHGGNGLLHSIWANFQPLRSNTILGPEWLLLHGQERAWAALGGTEVCFTPASFMQANTGAMEAALAAIAAWVPSGAAIADLHAGVGTIGLALVARCSPRLVRAVEINPAAEEPYQASAQLLQQHLRQQQGGELPPHLEFFAAAAGSTPERWLDGTDVVVCDPPRKGLEPALLSCLACPHCLPRSVRRLVYLSCGFPALRHDTEELLASSCWMLVHTEAFLFFPGTDHIETLVVFDRVR